MIRDENLLENAAQEIERRDAKLRTMERLLNALLAAYILTVLLWYFGVCR